MSEHSLLIFSHFHLGHCAASWSQAKGKLVGITPDVLDVGTFHTMEKIMGNDSKENLSTGTIMGLTFAALVVLYILGAPWIAWLILKYVNDPGTALSLTEVIMNAWEWIAEVTSTEKLVLKYSTVCARAFGYH